MALPRRRAARRRRTEPDPHECRPRVTRRLLVRSADAGVLPVSEASEPLSLPHGSDCRRRTRRANFGRAVRSRYGSGQNLDGCSASASCDPTAARSTLAERVGSLRAGAIGRDAIEIAKRIAACCVQRFARRG